MSVLLALFAAVHTPQAFSFQGSFFEGCTCANACAFELKGELPGCNGVGFYSFEKGEYGDESLAGTRVAFVAGSEGWLRLYYDGPSAKRRETARKFIAAALKDWGKPEAVEYRPITCSKKDWVYTGQIDGGKTLKLSVEAQVSAGETTTHKNIFNRLLHPEIMQAKTLGCTFKSGKRKMDFKNTNGFFHSDLKVSNKV